MTNTRPATTAQPTRSICVDSDVLKPLPARPDEARDQEKTGGTTNERADRKSRQLQRGNAGSDRKHLVGNRREAGDENDPDTVVIEPVRLSRRHSNNASLATRVRSPRTCPSQSRSRQGRREPKTPSRSWRSEPSAPDPPGTIGASMTSTGIGKNEDSAKLIAPR